MKVLLLACALSVLAQAAVAEQSPRELISAGRLLAADLIAAYRQSPAAASTKTLAVADLGEVGISADHAGLGAILADQFGRELSRSGLFSLVETTSPDRSIVGARWSENAVARDLVLLGSVACLGDSCSIAARIVEIKSRKILAMEQLFIASVPAAPQQAAPVSAPLAEAKSLEMKFVYAILRRPIWVSAALSKHEQSEGGHFGLATRDSRGRWEAGFDAGFFSRSKFHMGGTPTQTSIRVDEDITMHVQYFRLKGSRLHTIGRLAESRFDQIFFPLRIRIGLGLGCYFVNYRVIHGFYRQTPPLASTTEVRYSLQRLESLAELGISRPIGKNIELQLIGEYTFARDGAGQVPLPYGRAAGRIGLAYRFR